MAVNYGSYVSVQKGDTLWSIAEQFLGSGSNYKQLAAWNNISNPNLIYIGQQILLGKPSSGSSTGKTKSNAPVIDHFGLQSDADNTLFAMWTWNKSYTEKYQVKWEYSTKDGLWFVGSSSAISVDENDPAASRQSTYSIPSNATKVRFKVKPISKKNTTNDVEYSYWTANWSTEKIFNVNEIPPAAPTGLSVTVTNFSLTAEVNNLDSLGADKIEFQVVKHNFKVYKTGIANITTGRASYVCSLDAGWDYKVRCRAIRGNIYGAWSEYSSNVTTKPATPANISVCRASSETSVYLSWEHNSAQTFGMRWDIEYTTDERYFDGSSETTLINDIQYAHYEVTGLETGKEYFFRHRLTNDVGESGWSKPVSVIIGTVPSAPTTWSSTTTAIVGEEVTLFWVHNSEDGSKQTWADLEIYIDDVKYVTEPIEYPETDDDEDKNATGSYVIDTKNIPEGAEIKWRVRTAGILGSTNATKTFGDWSIQRIIDVYAPPTVDFDVTDRDGDSIETLEKFPFYISAKPGPVTQTPLSYHVYIIANESYEAIDQIGNTKNVNSGDEVYSKHFYTTEDLLIEMSAGNVDLENNIRYTVGCVVAMNSGLTAESEREFVVNWDEYSYEPNAQITVDMETLSASIKPYCDREHIYAVKASKNDSGEYEIDSPQVVFDYVYGESIKSEIDGSAIKTKTGETVFEGVDGDGNNVIFATVHTRVMVDNVALFVYRREYDGSFVELATDLDNSKNTFVTDPHPALDYARYRIVAIKRDTGAVGFYDMPGYPVGGNAVVIQWDEDWSNFDVTSEDALSQPTWGGSMLKIPYNIDKSTNYNPDVSLIEYVGREHPVSYYGTQIGEAETWNVEIPATDIETRYALRRLAKWMGDVYVREPSGRGYWAKITVSYSEKHKGVTIPVTFDITRVEGGA